MGVNDNGESRSKTVLVTGAASGMGEATCRLLAATGNSVIALDRDAVGLASLVETRVCRTTIEADLTDVAALRRSLSDLELDGVVNAAGVGPDARDVGTIFGVNLVAPLVVLDAVLPGLRPLASVVNVSSVTGKLADAVHDSDFGDPLSDEFLDHVRARVADGPAAYTYSKRLLIRHSRRLAVELAGRSRVNVVSPGIIDTPMAERSMQFEWTRKASDRIPAGRLGRPDEVARVIAFLIGDGIDYLTGSDIDVDGGYVAAQLERRLARRNST